jgi:hypothetical protein
MTGPAGLRSGAFAKLARAILEGMGMRNPVKFKAAGVDEALRVEVARVSSDGMFESTESWLCAFSRAGSEKALLAIADAGLAADVQRVFAVCFADAHPEAALSLRKWLADAGIGLALVTGELAGAGTGSRLRVVRSPCAPRAQNRRSSQLAVGDARMRGRRTVGADHRRRRCTDSAGVQVPLVQPPQTLGAFLLEQPLDLGVGHARRLLATEPGDQVL